MSAHRRPHGYVHKHTGKPGTPYLSVFLGICIALGALAYAAQWLVRNPIFLIPVGLIGIGWILAWRSKPDRTVYQIVRAPKQSHAVNTAPNLRKSAVNAAPAPSYDRVESALLARGVSESEARTLAKSSPWLYDLEDDQLAGVEL